MRVDLLLLWWCWPLVLKSVDDVLLSGVCGSEEQNGRREKNSLFIEAVPHIVQLSLGHGQRYQVKDKTQTLYIRPTYLAALVRGSTGTVIAENAVSAGLICTEHVLWEVLEANCAVSGLLRQPTWDMLIMITHFGTQSP